MILISKGAADFNFSHKMNTWEKEKNMINCILYKNKQNNDNKMYKMNNNIKTLQLK